MTELIRLDREGPVGFLRFLQPAKRNPYSIGFVEELVALLREAERDDTIRAVVMSGGDHFSSGGDLVGFQSEIAKGARATSEMVDLVHDGGRAAYLFRKPLISAVCGVAFGAGLSLALSADIVVAAEDARLCEVFARVGGCPDTGSSWLLQQRAGAGVARMLILTGREIDTASVRLDANLHVIVDHTFDRHEYLHKRGLLEFYDMVSTDLSVIEFGVSFL